ncbi:MAG: G-D-S-L family lipolytic protein [Bacteroidota bacterium]|nr:G-D-S-L family lipolytic protein [Bacteroidota bacterium]
MTNKIILLAVFVASMLLLAFTSQKKKKKVVFFGDSITAAAVRPGGYIKLMDSIVAQEGLADDYELVGAGVSGDKIYDLYLRIEEDVISKHPDIVLIYVGVNDVWHKTSSGTGTDFDKFGRFYQAVVNKLEAAGIKVIISTPAVIGEKTDYSNQQDGDLNLYSNWLRNYSAQHEIPFVDLRSAFHQYDLAHNPENKDRGILTVDRVHLTPAGNLFVAEAFWKAIKSVK